MYTAVDEGRLDMLAYTDRKTRLRRRLMLVYGNCCLGRLLATYAGRMRLSDPR